MSLLGLARKLIKEVGDEKGSALLDKVKDRSITASEIKEIRDAGIDLQALKKELGDVPKTKPKSIDKVKMPTNSPNKAKANQVKETKIEPEVKEIDAPTDKVSNKANKDVTIAKKTETKQEKQGPNQQQKQEQPSTPSSFNKKTLYGLGGAGVGASMLSNKEKNKMKEYMAGDDNSLRTSINQSEQPEVQNKGSQEDAQLLSDFDKWINSNQPSQPNQSVGTATPGNITPNKNDDNEVIPPSEYEKQLDSAISMFSKQKLDKDPEIKKGLNKIKEKVRQAKVDYKKSKDHTSWMALAESLGHALTTIGAGAYGLKHNVDMSGVKFNKTDWSKSLDNALKELELEQDIIGAEEAELKAMDKEEDKRITNLKEKLMELKLAKSRERDRTLAAAKKPEDKQPSNKIQEKLDTEFAKQVAEMTANPAKQAAATRNIQQLETAVRDIKDPGELTGTAWQRLPEFIRSFVDRKSLNTQQLIEQVVQQDLRNTLGAQFTEKEGEKLIARAYNKDLPEEQNLQRLKLLLNQMKEAKKNQEAAISHFNKYGTLKGFKGKLYKTADDFNLDQAETRTINGKTYIKVPGGWKAQ